MCISLLIAVFRDDQHIGDLAGCAVRFDADLSALRDEVLQFGSVTTSRIQSDDDHDVVHWPQIACRCCHNSAAQVSSLFHLILIDNGCTVAYRCALLLLLNFNYHIMAWAP